ncbi:PREDICTED: uncharacterized protein LOC109189715 [Ipomoea nil]|uniref:uncharacterized protein LOC109189715 n=1 Tax=Ipomoea nil TaxID=35883 RepID=UPI0009015C3C|nr:PREDICTED: uncharacterized protein LOC109189715 [Ipomoea nil]
MPQGCTVDGNLDESRYSEPMPWIGIYVAVASAACAAAMATDVFHGLRHRKFWFPCKFFSLNATTLAIIAVATKLSVDLNSSMPRHQDQLAKLTSGVLICTLMSNSMPSLAAMEYKELMMNIVALGIFVVTVIVNIGIQLGTGVIYTFWKEHAAVILIMLILFLLLISSALTVPTTRSYFDLKYSKKYKLAQKECCLGHGEFRPEKLKDELMKYWMMAHTCSPQFVASRLVTCTASGAFCLLSTVICAEAMLRSYMLPGTFEFCTGESDYKWSTTLILVAQTVAIVVGTIAPGFRWFKSINFRCPKKVTKACHYKVKVEDYWIRSLVLWKESPLDLRKRGRFVRKFAHNAKENLLDFCIWMQIGTVCLSKLVRMVSLFWVSWLLIGLRRLIKRDTNSIESHDSEPESKPDLSRYVLHLEGEETLQDFMMESNFDVSDHWIKTEKKRQPKNLIKFLQNWCPTKGFMGVNHFDYDHIPSLDSEEPPNCWALPVVTLASIAIALSGNDPGLSKELKSCVNEAVLYMRFLEDKLDANGDLTNLRKAAQMVWIGVDLHYKWLDLDLQKMGKDSPQSVLKALSEEAKQRYLEYKQKDVTICFAESPSKWPAKILAANSMYRTCQALLLTNENEQPQNNNTMMFHRLSDMITGIVGACLTNIPRVIFMLCHQGSIKERETRVRFAILLLGKSGKILEILNHRLLPSSCSERLVHIDDWRALSKEKDHQQHWNFSPAEDDKALTGSPDFRLTVE